MSHTSGQDNPRVLLLTTTRSYRSAAFLNAAERLGIEVVQAVNMPKALHQSWTNGFGVDFGELEAAVATISAYHQKHALRAVLAVDDSGSVLAAAAGGALGLTHNSAEAARATRDKLLFRRLLRDSGLNSPQFCEVTADKDGLECAASIGFPCVVKPRSLNGSRGVIRADNAEQLKTAVARAARLVRRVEGTLPDSALSLLVERYIPGVEIALEGILAHGRLQILALFDKPDPLEGPFFEESIYVTPSRLPDDLQKQIAEQTAAAAARIGLITGPVHAELRLNEEGPWILEVAGRSIGGLCSQILQFGTDASLEEIILRQACGLDYENLLHLANARGVMMIPIPGAGLLREVKGLHEALQIPFIEGIEITAPLDNPLTPLPEGDGYLGFIFAKGPAAADVEGALRAAHRHLSFRIDPLLPVLQPTSSNGR